MQTSTFPIEARSKLQDLVLSTTFVLYGTVSAVAERKDELSRLNELPCVTSFNKNPQALSITSYIQDVQQLSGQILATTISITEIYNRLVASYENQFLRFSDYVENLKPASDRIFFDTVNKLINGSEKAKVSISGSPSLFFTFFYHSTFELRFECFLETKRAAYSLYKNGELEARNHGAFLDMIFESKNYVELHS
jgi:hypothetical protein